ncbi:MAG: polysaccharide biosynthesis protein [Paracoccaceae bacterium]|nr:polysaccharide biosynthesis protein [Paracoccaceae bacterium]
MAVKAATAILTHVVELTRPAKAAILLLVDSLLTVVALWAALLLVADTAGLGAVLSRLPLLLGAGAAASVALGVAQTRLRDYDLPAVLRTAALALLLAGAARLVYGSATLPGSVVVFAMCFFAASVLSRIMMREALVWLYRAAQRARPVIIYGAGTTGLRIAAALRSDDAIKPVAFVDDNAALHGLTMAGLRVHSPLKLAEISAKTGASAVILAMPTLAAGKRAEISRRLAGLGLEVRALPAFAQIIGKELRLDQLAPVNPIELLSRAQLCYDNRRLAESYAGRSILVTGAGGSIGSELCRQILACGPRRLILLELSEHALFQVDRELRADPAAANSEVVPVLGSVTDPRLVRSVIRGQGVEVILHAAAYKHVPLVEANAVSGLANNVLGTHALAREALSAGVERFILISSDKAVQPTSVMGASKRLAELVVQDLAQRAPVTRFAAVRFGNVLGSSGSVIPVFREQIAAGGPVTLTDPDATRYFMTVEEAVHLVLVAGAEAAGGETFVLDMGEPVRIADLARKMIEAAGYSVRDAQNPAGDIAIRVIGLRAGERTHEVRMTDGALPSGAHPAVLKVEAPVLSEIEVAGAIRAIRGVVNSGDANAALLVIERFLGEASREAESARRALTT